MKTKELLAHIRRHATDVPYSLNVHEWAEAARRACDIIEQLQAENERLRAGIKRTLKRYRVADKQINSEGFVRSSVAWAMADDLEQALKGELEAELKHEQYIKENRNEAN